MPTMDNPHAKRLMEQIVEVKTILKNKDLLSILAESIYNPTEERLNSRAEKYMINRSTAAFAFKSNDTYKGLIILDKSNSKELIILNIAVLNSYKKSGIGSSLINHCIRIFEPDKIIAETDDEAIGFYIKFGFDILPLGDIYGAGIVRYKCTFTCRLCNGNNRFYK